MIVYDEASTRRTLSVWGKEVKRRLNERELRQDELVDMLRARGFSVSKSELSNLLCGTGATSHQAEIDYINALLGIPFRK